MDSRIARMAALVGVVVLAGALCAQQPQQEQNNGWRLYGGPAWRQGPEIDFVGRDLSGLNLRLARLVSTPSTDGVNSYAFTNGSFDANGNFVIANADQYREDWLPEGFVGGAWVYTREVYLDVPVPRPARVLESSDDIDDMWGGILGLEKELTQVGAITLGLDFAFQYFTSDSAQTQSANSALDLNRYDLTINAFTLDNDMDLDNDGDTADTRPLSQDDPAGGAHVYLAAPPLLDAADDPAAIPVALTVRRTSELDLYVLSLGCSAACDLGGSVTVRAGIGPSWTYADLSTDIMAAARAGGQTVSQTWSDDETASEFGWYGTIGVEFRVSRAISLSLNYRYDWVADEISTDLAEVDLSGSSANLALSFRF